MPSHILMLDDCGRFAWVPHFKVNELKAIGWTLPEKN